MVKLFPTFYLKKGGVLAALDSYGSRPSKSNKVVKRNKKAVVRTPVR